MMLGHSHHMINITGWYFKHIEMCAKEKSIKKSFRNYFKKTSLKHYYKEYKVTLYGQ